MLGITPNDILKIKNNIELSSVSILNAPTGSGKSTTVIKSLYEFNEVENTIFVLQPTRPATTSLHDYMQTKIGEKKCGFAADSIIKYKNNHLYKICSGKSIKIKENNSENTKVVYATYGHFKNKILRFKSYIDTYGINCNLRFCDIIVADEAHCGNMDLEMILGLFRYIIDLGCTKIPKLMLSSATILPEETSFPDSPFYQIKSKSYPVEIQYHKKDYSLTDKNLISDTIQIIIQKHQDIRIKDEGSIWLVFCSGSAEVEQICKALLTLNDNSIYVCPAYSDLIEELIALAMERFEEKQQLEHSKDGE